MTNLARSALCSILLLLLACGGCTEGMSPSGSALGEAGGDETLYLAAGAPLTVEAGMNPAFDLARAGLFGGADPGETTLDALPGRRTFVCVYGVEHPNLCGTGVGPDLAASVRAATADLSERSGPQISKAQQAGDDVRIKIDVVTKTERRTFKRDVEKPKKRDVALYGYWVQNAGQASYVLPSEILEQALYSDNKAHRGIVRKELNKVLQRRNKSLGSLPEEFPYDQLFTASWVEEDPRSEAPGIVRLYRTHRYAFDELTEELLLQRTIWAADYLISSVSPQGKVRYVYYPATDRDSNDYNLLRHGGTTYSMLQAYDRTKYEPYRLASVAAIDYLFRACKEDERTGPFGGGPGRWILESGKNKLGGAGLGLVMLNQYAEATGDYERYRADAVKFGNFLVASLKADGEFIYFPSLTPDGPPTDTDDSAYYPGEAILGLIRLYAYDPQEKWLTAARAASDWLIDVRDAGKDERALANDHWLMIALSYLYDVTRDRKYVEHSMNLARAVKYQYDKNMPLAKDYPDYEGGYYDPPRSTPAATRGEGLVAVLDTCQLAEADCEWVWELLLDTIRHENLSQYDADLVYWIKNKRKSFGGWNGGLIDSEIRNDFVQHNMSAVIGTERHLARRTRGEERPGGPAWTSEQKKAVRLFPGVPAADVERLHAQSQRYRGDTHWEKVWKQGAGAGAPTDESPATAPLEAEGGEGDEGGEGGE